MAALGRSAKRMEDQDLGSASVYSMRSERYQSPNFSLRELPYRFFASCRRNSWVATIVVLYISSAFADSPQSASPAENSSDAEWAAKSKEMAALFIEVPDFDDYPKDKKEACEGLPNLIRHGFSAYGVNHITGEAYSGRVEFQRASDKYHLIAKRQIGDWVEWGVARFIYTMGGTDPGFEHTLRLLVVRWQAGDEIHTIRYEHIHRLNFDPESKFVGSGKIFHETLLMDSL